MLEKSLQISDTRSLYHLQIFSPYPVAYLFNFLIVPFDKQKSLILFNFCGFFKFDYAFGISKKPLTNPELHRFTLNPTPTSSIVFSSFRFYHFSVNFYIWCEEAR